MNIKIGIAAHKVYRMPSEKSYLPIQVGAHGKDDIGYTRDDIGDNISEKNPYYCELTGLYWMWKILMLIIVALYITEDILPERDFSDLIKINLNIS